jgi:hypothetical protein
MEDAGNFLAIWSILPAIWYIFGYLIYNFLFWYFVPRKIWQPCTLQPKKRGIGLSYFSWYNIPKRGKIYQITIKCTKCP